MNKRFGIASLRPMIREQSSLCAALVTIFTLGGMTAGWALCPLAEWPIVGTGGGNCICNTWAGGVCDVFGCERGTLDWLSKDGGCTGSLNSYTGCHAFASTWAKLNYAPNNCYTLGSLVEGSCSALPPASNQPDTMASNYGNCSE